MKKLGIILFSIFSLNCQAKLLNKLGPVAEKIWNSVPDATIPKSNKYQGQTLVLVIGAGLETNNAPYWGKSFQYGKTMNGNPLIYQFPIIYGLDEVKAMMMEGMDVYFLVSPEVSKSELLATLPVADILIYIGHGGYENNEPKIFNMEESILAAEKRTGAKITGVPFYSVTNKDLLNIKFKPNCLVLLPIVCYAAGMTATDPKDGISLAEASKRTAAFSQMFLSRGAKCYLATNSLYSPLKYLRQGLSILEVREELVKQSYKGYYQPVQDNTYINPQHIIYGKDNHYDFCLVGDFTYQIKGQ